jgi:uncharacterized protein YgiM (DUF1202 family)
MFPRTVRRGAVAVVAALALSAPAVALADAPARHHPSGPGYGHSQGYGHGQGYGNGQGTGNYDRWHGGSYRRGHVVRPFRVHSGRALTHGARLNVRSGPGTGYRIVGWAGNGRMLHLTCKRQGSYVRGNARWYRLTRGQGYVSARYVHNYQTIPWC